MLCVSCCSESCRTFDASADGYGRGEGVVVLILGSSAASGSSAAAVLGSAINQDGRSSGLTAPNGPSQTLLVKQALSHASLQPGEVGTVAVHGTGMGWPMSVL